MLQRMKSLFKATDMTVGEPWKQIVMFTLPMLIGNIAQQLYSTVDSIVVGKYVGDNAYKFVNAVSDFATHAKPLRETAKYKENLFLKTVEGNTLIDKAYQMVRVA